MKADLEVALFGSRNWKLLTSAGVYRFELARRNSHTNGGLTPTLDDVEGFKSSTAPVRVLIRPRAAPQPTAVETTTPPPRPEGDGPAPPASAAETDPPNDLRLKSLSAEQPDFVYDVSEIAEMAESIAAFKPFMDASRGDGFVFGLLSENVTKDTKEPNGFIESAETILKIDTTNCKKLIKIARPFKCIFHRAFDLLLAQRQPGPEALITELRSVGFHGVLTSGGPGNAFEPDNNARLQTLCSCLATRKEDDQRGTESRAQKEEKGGKVPVSGADMDAGKFELIVGGGIRSEQFAQVVKNFEAWLNHDLFRLFFHSACITDATRDRQEADIVEVRKLLDIIQ